ncbi:hypothetical protein EDD18DRAFT_1111601 [Armillaria luteobubalina]|uniref:MYND-type domain-containing protein n=1 Tax=Armillaria luteobubalina TaxID=153913 RepID=A0AA39UIP1_9AGAR|nr:hypothetical protein EDD18DRAFT_1312425 [Armillaria luteobubalina]KAK0480450.1 hypothetical protein EDD18DRAFT_1363764 [Armillaria luteobubalina]KAK0485458.1 hypothetical protein EDD18DRAFT_1111601 [Armillaria luteobubalina]
MDRRVGIERSTGPAGGGVVSAASQRNYEIGAELCRKRKPNEAAPYLLKAIEDHNNLDAFVEMSFLMPDWESRLDVLSIAAENGKKLLKARLGPNCFDDSGPYVGGFWEILDTRPYMRVLEAQVRLSFESGDYKLSAETNMEMLRLCPGDNLNQRTWLGPLLCRLERYSDALYFAHLWIEDFISDHTNYDPPYRGGTAFKAPGRKLFSPEDEKKVNNSPCSMTYTAALAAFKLWGDCEESRQYLRVASKGNPHVMIKVLGRINRPEQMNMSSRGWNGPEVAHDYLWLVQDLWMNDDVWNWADNHPEAKEATFKICAKPSCTLKETRAAEFQRCSSCHLVSYCSQACQKADWKRHKPDCQFHKMKKAAVHAFHAGKAAPEGCTIPIVAADFSGGAVHVYDGNQATVNGVPIPDPSTASASASKKKKKNKKKNKKPEDD